MKHDWMTDAACLDGAISDFVPDEGDYTAARRAKTVCAGCPVAKQCLEYGNTVSRKHGVYGGLSPRERFYRRKEPAA